MAVKSGFKIIIAVIIAVIVTTASTVGVGIIASALFDTDQAVHIDAEAIENSTLIIGTHLIDIHSLNDAIYQLALDSASQSGQDRMYYKSELADGMWFDITDAGSLKDITTSGSIADAAVIEDLYFTHHTKSDGITYDLLNNQAICIFDIYNVYDLESMPELEALKMQYDMMRESGSNSKTAKRNLELVRQFFAMQVTSGFTVECDTQISSLQGYYQELASNNAASGDTEMVLKIMSKVDNARKAAVYTMVSNGLSNLQDAIADVSASDDDGDEDMDMDDALLTAIGNSQYSVSESMSEAEGNMLARGNTVISETEYNLSIRMITNANSSNYAGCDEQNFKLQSLDNINNARIVNRQEERKLLEELIGSADIKYGVSLSAGAGQEYNELVAKNASHAALQNRIKEDIVDTNAIRSELQFFIQGMTDREEKQDAEAYILERIQDAAKFRVVIKSDDYAGEFQNSVALYVKWLNELLSSIKENGNSQSASENLYEQKASLQEQKRKALDGLDLDTAKRIDAQLEALAEDIEAIESAASGTLKELNEKKTQLEKVLESDPQNVTLQIELSRLEVEIASNRTDLPQESQAANIMESKNEIVELLAEGDTSEAALNLISNDIDLLTSMLDGGSPLALEALKEVYNKMLSKSELEDMKEYQTLQKNIERTVSESSVNASLSGEVSVQEITKLIADSLEIGNLIDENGNLSDNASREDIAASLIALGNFSKKTETNTAQQGSGKTDENTGENTGNNGETSSVKSFTDGIGAALTQSGDGYVFQTKQQGSESYVPAQVLAKYLGYRYVWNDTKKNAVLSKGRTFYSYTAFRESVENENGEILYMDFPASFAGELYIPGSFVETEFECYIYNIYGTNYSVLVNDKVVEKSQEILSELLEKGGY